MPKDAAISTEEEAVISKRRVIGIGAIILVLLESAALAILNWINPAPAEIADYIFPLSLILIGGALVTYVSVWVVFGTLMSWYLNHQKIDPSYEGERVETLKFAFLIACLGLMGVGTILVLDGISPSIKIGTALWALCYAIILWIIAAGIGIRAGIVRYLKWRGGGETKEATP